MITTKRIVNRLIEGIEVPPLPTTKEWQLFDKKQRPAAVAMLNSKIVELYTWAKTNNVPFDDKLWEKIHGINEQVADKYAVGADDTEPRATMANWWNDNYHQVMGSELEFCRKWLKDNDYTIAEDWRTKDSILGVISITGRYDFNPVAGIVVADHHGKTVARAADEQELDFGVRAYTGSIESKILKSVYAKVAADVDSLNRVLEERHDKTLRNMPYDPFDL